MVSRGIQRTHDPFRSMVACCFSLSPPELVSVAVCGDVPLVLQYREDEVLQMSKLNDICIQIELQDIG